MIAPTHRLSSELSRATWIESSSKISSHAKSDHQLKLVQLQADIAAMLAKSECDVNTDVLGERLERLISRLDLHFTLEEELGCLDTALAMAPRLAQQVAALRNEQESLFVFLCEIAGDADRLRYVTQLAKHQKLDSIRQRFELFCRNLQDHDEREIDLVLEAVYFDIGGGG